MLTTRYGSQRGVQGNGEEEVVVHQLAVLRTPDMAPSIGPVEGLDGACRKVAPNEVDLKKIHSMQDMAASKDQVEVPQVEGSEKSGRKTCQREAQVEEVTERVAEYRNLSGEMGLTMVAVPRCGKS